MHIGANIDLLSVGIAIATAGVLGAVILMSNPKSFTSRAFFLFTLITVIWGVLNYLSYQISSSTTTLWLIRVVMFFATLQASSFYFLLSIFPDERYRVTKKEILIGLPALVFVAFMSLTPYVFSGITIAEGSKIAQPIPGTGIPLFAFITVSFMLVGISKSIKKMRTTARNVRPGFIYILLGVCLMLSLIVTFNFLFPTLLSNTRFIPLSALFTLPFTILTSYAIRRHNFFNIKVAATAIFTSILALVSLAEVILAEDISVVIFRTITFLLILAFGILLIRTVLKEVQAREEVSILAKRLTDSNVKLEKSNAQLKILDQRKSEFVSLVSHQLRAPIAAIKGYSSMLLEDSYGTLSDLLKKPIENIFLSSQRLVEMVAEFLDISKIEQGAMTFTFTAVNIVVTLQDLIGEFVPVAQKRGLILDFQFSKNEKFIVTADEGKIRQVFSNLIDNSIKYTPEGSVRVSLEKDIARHKVVARIKDTGIGLSPEDMAHIFGKFTRASGGQKENVEGSGLGLYVAKKMVEAQKGNIRVESEGVGKGSTFIIELPAEA